MLISRTSNHLRAPSGTWCTVLRMDVIIAATKVKVIAVYLGFRLTLGYGASR